MRALQGNVVPVVFPPETMVLLQNKPAMHIIALCSLYVRTKAALAKRETTCHAHTTNKIAF